MFTLIFVTRTTLVLTRVQNLMQLSCKPLLVRLEYYFSSSSPEDNVDSEQVSLDVNNAPIQTIEPSGCRDLVPFLPEPILKVRHLGVSQINKVQCSLIGNVIFSERSETNRAGGLIGSKQNLARTRMPNLSLCHVRFIAAAARKVEISKKCLVEI